MGKDTTAFRERFNAYKNGKSVSEIYDAGLPKYGDGKQGKKKSRFNESLGGKYLYIIDNTIDYLHSQGVDPMLIAGILGNMALESGFNPDSIGPGGFAGTVQMSSDMANEIKRAYGKVDYKTTNRFIHDAMSGNKIISQPWRNYMKQHGGYYGRTFNSAGDAAMAFGRVFERPNEKYANWASRMLSAEHALDYINLRIGTPSELIPVTQTTAAEYNAAHQFQPWSNYHLPDYSLNNPAPTMISSMNNPSSPTFTTPELQSRRSYNNIKDVAFDIMNGKDVEDALMDNLSKNVFGGKKIGFKNGKLPGYTGGKTVIGSNVNMNDDGTFTDDYTRAFEDVVITPKGPRVKAGQLYKYQEPWDDEKFLNAVTVGGLNNLSPAQWARRTYDAVTGNLTTESWLNGNAGIVPTKYAEEHPNAAMAANALFDFWTLGGPSLLKNASQVGKLNPISYTKYEPQPIAETKPTTVLIQPKSYLIEDIPGYQLKTLMRGNPLEKQLSKSGTISTNSIQAQANKASEVEKVVINKVLQQEEFAGQKAIDYNRFRKAVHNNLITYDVKPDARYEDFGISRLGFEEPTSVDRANRLWQKAYDEAKLLHPSWSEQELTDFTNNVMGPIRHPLRLNTYTFESSKIPMGDSKHYDSSTLGHSRTYTSGNDPDILHVMESLSDWGQHQLDLRPEHHMLDANMFNVDENGNIILNDFGKQYINSQHSELAQEKYLHDNYIFRQIQENLKYAAERGLTKMRYPTPDTAAKIEGYLKDYGDHLREMTEAEWEEFLELREKVRTLGNDRPKVTRRNSLDENGNVILLPRLERDEWDALHPEFVEAYNKYMNIQNRIVDNTNGHLMILDQSTSDYRPEHKTILKKYADFPKQFKKLHKNTEVREVTDTKGNTWYEVDVPKDFLKKEWMYGMSIPTVVGAGLSLNANGKLPSYANGKISIKPSKRGSFTAAAKKYGVSVAEFERRVLKNPEKYSKAMRKKAQFSHNARSWKH